MPKLKIGNFEFRTKAQAEDYVRGILSRYSNGAMLVEGDERFVRHLIDAHPHREAVIGCGIKYIIVQHLKDKYNSRRFAVIRRDAEMRDFTWRHAIYPRNAEQDVAKVCRWLIHADIRRFRDAAFGPLDLIKCPVTEEWISVTDADVDHIAPDTFMSLLRRWVKSIGLECHEIEIVPSEEYEQQSRFNDEWLAVNWLEFHRQNARLRVVSSLANRSLLRKGRLDGGQRA